MKPDRDETRGKCVVHQCPRAARYEFPYGAPFSGRVLCPRHFALRIFTDPAALVLLSVLAFAYGIYRLFAWLPG